ncbi:ComEA family DNA-binding protein [Saccharopolyspora halophila]|uniref:ComEA family DNA-binding protein n=1 Tax=Saccharopolyspora halophila TaxID=405551 RepID=A0ABN3GPT7_9PSEU
MLDGKVFSTRDDGLRDALGPQQRLQALHRRAGREEPRERVSRDYSVDPPPDTARRSPLRRFAERWLPESLLRSRVDPGRAGLLAIALVTVVVLIGVLALATSARPTAEEAPPPLPPPPVETTTSTSAPAELVVSVVGQVQRPGLVTVAEGARVAEAVEAAGGALPGTDLTTLNLARRLTDGEQLYVAVPIPPRVRQPESAAQQSGSGKVDLNSATEEQLDELPGVGEVTAERILKWRAEHGGFDSVDQLGQVGGIGEVRLSRLRELVRV